MSRSQKRRAYGLCCDVQFDWPWAPLDTAGSDAQLRIQLGELGRYAAHPERDYQPYALRPARSGAAMPAVSIERASDGHFRITYADGARFIVDPARSEVWGSSRGDLTLDDLIVYLQGPIFGFVLRQRGVTCLHASAAVANGRAFAVVGPAGMGKSTSAAAFARAGLMVLTDDVLALDDFGNRFEVRPGLPRVLLWPESVAALWGREDALPRVVHNWQKCYLDLAQPGYHFAGSPAKLAAIYVLSERRPSSSQIEIAASSGTDALLQLVANTYSNDLIDTPARARELEVLGRLATNVCVRRVHAVDDRSAINRVCAAIVADFEALGEA